MPRNANPTRQTHQADLLEWMRARPQGATAAEMRAALGCPRGGKMQGACRLSQMGLLGFVLEANTAIGHPQARRYFAREHCPLGAVLVEGVKPLVRPQAGQAMTVVPKRARQPSRPSGEAIVPPNLRPTILPGFTGAPRWAPSSVEPFFAAGKRVEGETWAKHYTERRA